MPAARCEAQHLVQRYTMRELGRRLFAPCLEGVARLCRGLGWHAVKAEAVALIADVSPRGGEAPRAVDR